MFRPNRYLYPPGRATQTTALCAVSPFRTLRLRGTGNTYFAGQFQNHDTVNYTESVAEECTPANACACLCVPSRYAALTKLLQSQASCDAFGIKRHSYSSLHACLCSHYATEVPPRTATEVLAFGSCYEWCHFHTVFFFIFQFLRCGTLGSLGFAVYEWDLCYSKYFAVAPKLERNVRRAS